jgi:hypothetical protein
MFAFKQKMKENVFGNSFSSDLEHRVAQIHGHNSLKEVFA